MTIPVEEPERCKLCGAEANASLVLAGEEIQRGCRECLQALVMGAMGDDE